MSEEIKYIGWSQVVAYLWDGWTVKPMTRWHGEQNRFLAVREIQDGHGEGARPLQPKENMGGNR